MKSCIMYAIATLCVCFFFSISNLESQTSGTLYTISNQTSNQIAYRLRPILNDVVCHSGEVAPGEHHIDIGSVTLGSVEIGGHEVPVGASETVTLNSGVDATVNAGALVTTITLL